MIPVSFRSIFGSSNRGPVAPNISVLGTRLLPYEVPDEPCEEYDGSGEEEEGVCEPLPQRDEVDWDALPPIPQSRGFSIFSDERVFPANNPTNRIRRSDVEEEVSDWNPTREEEAEYAVINAVRAADAELRALQRRPFKVELYEKLESFIRQFEEAKATRIRRLNANYRYPDVDFRTIPQLNKMISTKAAKAPYHTEPERLATISGWTMHDPYSHDFYTLLDNYTLKGTPDQIKRTLVESDGDKIRKSEINRALDKTILYLMLNSIMTPKPAALSPDIRNYRTHDEILSAINMIRQVLPPGLYFEVTYNKALKIFKKYGLLTREPYMPV